MWVSGEEHPGKRNGACKGLEAEICSVCSKGSVAGVDVARGEYEEMRSERKGGVSIRSLSGNHKDFIFYCEDREVITSFEQRNAVV